MWLAGARFEVFGGARFDRFGSAFPALDGTTGNNHPVVLLCAGALLRGNNGKMSICFCFVFCLFNL